VQLHYLGRFYPDPNYQFQQKLHDCFARSIGASDEQVREGMKKAEWIKKEVEALSAHLLLPLPTEVTRLDRLFLKKYRTMKRHYYD
jgi:hypothetical protein